MAPTATTLDLQIVQVPIDDLHPDPANPRKISAEQLDTLTRSLRQFGFLQPVIPRHDDHVVVGGHQRLVAARRLGYKTVPVIFVDLNPEQSHLLNLALNRISGDWDEQLLARMLADLQHADGVDWRYLASRTRRSGGCCAAWTPRRSATRPSTSTSMPR